MFEIGSSLREARVRQEIDFPEAEQATKIRAKYLRALEDERFELLPAHTYVKGFLHSYADYLGLDGQLYVDEYNSRYVLGDEEAPVRVRRGPGARRPRHQARRVSGLVLLALGGIAAATALVIAAWRFGGADDPSVRGLEPSGATGASTGAVQQPARPPAAPTRVTIWAARGDTALEVRRGTQTGPVIYRGTLERGQEQRFAGRRFVLRVGSPEIVRLSVNGERALLQPRWGLYVATPNGLARLRPGA